ncbi:glycosyltransferase family 39 protein [Flavobacteriales bacterium]|nr:glycosyltransferase family 39 protein [Flavobacteriales bacterium]
MLSLVKDYQKLIALILVITVFLISIVDNVGFWHDEFYTLGLLRGFDIYLFPGSDLIKSGVYSSTYIHEFLAFDSFWVNLKRNLIHEGHPPLYYLILRVWTNLFGVHEFGLRSFSIALFATTIYVSYQVGLALNLKRRLLLPILVSVTPVLNLYALEARSYSMYYLFSMLSLLFCIKFLLGNSHDSSKSKLRALTYFIVFSTLLIYTHYYGVFFYGILSITIALNLFSRRDFKQILMLIFPLLLFLPWTPFILHQMSAHSEHWTDGYLGFGASFYYYIVGFFTLCHVSISSPFSYLSFIAIIGVIVNCRKWIVSHAKDVIMVVGLFLFYGVMIITFDKILDHHTISVPRYYLPIHAFFVTALALLIDKGKLRWLANLVVVLLIAVCGMAVIELIHNGGRQKQMCQEVASYINSNLDPEKTELVVIPNGPTAVGISYYLPRKYEIRTVPLDEVCDAYNYEDVVVIEQRLGLSCEAWNLSCKTNQIDARTIRFVGIDVVKGDE